MYNSVQAIPKLPAKPALSLVPSLPLLDEFLMWRVLDEIDYGLILTNPKGQIQHANHLGRYEMARAKFMRASSGGCAVKGFVQANDLRATKNLLSGIHDAACGRRQMLTLRDGSESLSVACVPLVQPLEGQCAFVLLMLGRHTDTANLSLGFFARSHKLTSTEEGVLRALCRGHQIVDIAASSGVAVSTIRSHVRALRDKTQCSSILLMVQLVAALPPVVPVSIRVQNISNEYAQTSP